MGDDDGSGKADTAKRVTMDEEQSSEIDLTFTTLMGDQGRAAKRVYRRKCEVCKESGCIVPEVRLNDVRQG